MAVIVATAKSKGANTVADLYKTTTYIVSQEHHVRYGGKVA